MAFFPAPIGPKPKPTSTARGPTACLPRERGSNLSNGGGISRKSGGRLTPPDRSPSIRIRPGWRPRRNGRADRRGPRHFPPSGRPPLQPDCPCTMERAASTAWSSTRTTLPGGSPAHPVGACGRHWIQATVGPCSAHQTGPEWGCPTWPFTRRMPSMCSRPQAMRISAAPMGWASWRRRMEDRTGSPPASVLRCPRPTRSAGSTAWRDTRTTSSRPRQMVSGSARMEGTPLRIHWRASARISCPIRETRPSGTLPSGRERFSGRRMEAPAGSRQQDYPTPSESAATPSPLHLLRQTRCGRWPPGPAPRDWRDST